MLSQHLFPSAIDPATRAVFAVRAYGRSAEVADFLRASHLPAVVSPDEMRLLHLGKFLDDSRKLAGTRQFELWFSRVLRFSMRSRLHGWCASGVVAARDDL